MLLAPPLLAQTAPPPSPFPVTQADRTRIPPTREEIERGRPVTLAPRGPRLRVEGGIERAPCPLAEPRFAAVEVTLSSVEFAGLRALDPDVLRPAYEGRLGQKLPIAVVCDIRDAAATILRRQGYLAAVQVPAQRIEGGHLKLQVLMAHLSAVRVRGNAGRAEKLIAAYLRPLTREDAFNEHEAERALLLVRDLPGYDVRLQLQPSGTPGEVIGEVTVVHHTLDIDANIQNFGANNVGTWGGLLRAQFYGLTGLGDRTTISFYTTPEVRQQKVVTASHEFLLGATGIGVAGHFTYSWTRPDEVRIYIDSRALIGSGELNYPFIRRQSLNLRGAAGFEVIDQTVDLNGARLSTDRLRVPYLRLDGEAIDPASRTGAGGYTANEPRWQVSGTLELRQGVHALGTSLGCGPNLVNCRPPGPTTPPLVGTPPSRAYGNPAAFVARLGGEADFRPIPTLTFAFSPRAQYAPDPLLSFEEYSAGNYTIGRGYDPGTLLGDKGAGGSLEVRAGRAAPSGPRAIAVQPFAFVDSAWAWSNAPGDPRAAQTLTSFGIGARGAFGDRARLDATFSIPTDRVGLETRVPGPRLLISFTTRLFPWSRR